MKKNGVERLNLVMTYPVNWDVHHVMSDYLQNFYDVLGPDNFAQGFSYFYYEDSKELRMESKYGFDIDWLKYIGVSTKRDNNSQYTAGKFGEGFKIASLCAYRDHKMSIHMESQDWAFDVIKISDEIDGNSVDFLGYDIKERLYKDNAVLLLGNVDEKAFQDFKQVMQEFFYPENPVFGDCLISTDDFAIYTVKSSENPGNQIVHGRLFASMQERARLRDVPLIFCNHKYVPDRKDDRDRGFFYSYEIVEAVEDIVCNLQGEVLRKVFMAFSNHWQASRRRSSYVDWSKVISTMLLEIEFDRDIRKKVYDCLKDKYIADMPNSFRTKNKNVYKTAMTWFRDSEFHTKLKILPSHFSSLGITTVCDLCAKYDGFNTTTKPNILQMKRIQILERVARDIFSDMVCYDTFPDCKLIISEESPNNGLAKSTTLVGAARNGIGLEVVSHVTEVCIRKELLDRDSFADAVPVYIHELMHQFGGEASGQFRIAIQALSYRIMQSFEKLESYEQEWLAVGE